MNFLLQFEARLVFFQRYLGKMGQYRPVHKNEKFVSRVTEKEESLFTCLEISDDVFEIVFYVGDNDLLSWGVANEADRDEVEKTLAEKLPNLEKLSEIVASLYQYNLRCRACGNFCNTQNYCSEMCKRSIPCDQCGTNRLPDCYDVEDLSANDHVILCCQFCKNKTKKHDFTIDTIGNIMQKMFPHIEEKYPCSIFSCDKCDALFMHDVEWLKTIFNKSCFPCKLK